MREHRLLIVEDDPVVGKVLTRLAGDVPGFFVVGVARTTGAARTMTKNLRPELVFLDLGLPDGNGLDLLRELRWGSSPVEVIVVTAAASTAAARTALQLGVVDYLIKPFRPARLHQAVGRYRHLTACLSTTKIHQSDIDTIRGTRRWLPKDVSEARLTDVLDVLATEPEPVTAAQVGERLTVSRVTARRYLEYLVTVGEVNAWSMVSGPGRPRKGYELRQQS